MARLPEAGGDEGQWGTLLNEFLRVAHQENGEIRNNYTVVNVKDLGATGDGTTDDYAALQQAAATINGMGGGTLVFPPGVYRIDQYKITGGENRNTVDDIIFRDCTSLQILGYGAKIDVKGDIHRTADYQREGHDYSYINTVVPFRFENCHNFAVAGFEIDGNVDQMTRDPSVVETAPGHGITAATCSQFTFSNLYIHHFQVDGIALTAFSDPDRPPNSNATLINVRSTNNARTGMSIDQLDGGLFLGCHFSSSGISEGSYGGHAPQAGFNIEPRNERTRNITFLGCEFRENVGTQFSATVSQNIYLNRCHIVSRVAESPEQAYLFTMLLAATDVHLANSYIDTGPGYIHATVSEGSTAKITDCEIRSSGFGVASGISTPLHIERCRFIGTFTGPSAQAQPNLRNDQCWFINNNIFRPAIAYDAESRTFDLGSVLEVQHSEHNTFRTDLVPTTTEHFFVGYAQHTLVHHDSYSGNAQNAFRPGPNATWNTDVPYARGVNNVSNEIFFGGRRHLYGDMPPATGTWNRGDMIYNIRPVAGGSIGWICVTSGEPGQWRSFGTISAT